MTIIEWLLLAEVVLSFGLIAWLLSRAHKHVKKNPALKSLEKHLAELEADKAKSTKDKEPNVNKGAK